MTPLDRTLRAPLIALGCALALLAAPERAHAQDAGAARAATATAIVEDIYGERMDVEEPSFYKPSSGFSLGGGGKGTKLRELHAWKGAHEVLIPLEKIVKIEVGKATDQGLIEVKLTLANNVKFDCKVDLDLEIRGKVQYGQYQAKIDRLKVITIRA